MSLREDGLGYILDVAETTKEEDPTRPAQEVLR